MQWHVIAALLRAAARRIAPPLLAALIGAAVDTGLLDGRAGEALLGALRLLAP